MSADSTLSPYYSRGSPQRRLNGARPEKANPKTAGVECLIPNIQPHPGKGDRERLIPLGEEGMRALNEFSGSVRDEILLDRQTDYLFPTRAAIV
jgi:hypothetical protein